MKIADYFRKPITTFCEVQGVDTQVVVEVDYQPPMTGGPACNLCGKPCDVLQVDNCVDSGSTAISRCCKVGYRVGPAGLLTEQAEVVEVKNLRGVSVMDSMYMVELQELEDRLLAMAHSETEARKEDARKYALEMREEALLYGQMQRGLR